MELIELIDKIKTYDNYELSKLGVSPFTQVEEEKRNYDGTLFLGCDADDPSYYNRVLVRGVLKTGSYPNSKVIADIDKIGLFEEYYLRCSVSADSPEYRAILKFEKQRGLIKAAVIYPLSKVKEKNEFFDIDKILSGKYDLEIQASTFQFDHRRTYMGHNLIFEI